MNFSLNDDVGTVLHAPAPQLHVSAAARAPPRHSDSTAAEDAMIAAMFQRIDYWPKKVFSPRPTRITKLDPGIILDKPEKIPSHNNSFRNKVYSNRKSPE